jgi:TetR/AcrR family transcriptional regulator, biofilm operon repressor
VADKKTEILDAALLCFARYGYDKATLSDIGDLVGMNKVSLYYYFPNKEALFKEALGREAAQYDALSLEAARGARGFRAKIRSWIDHGFRYSQQSELLRHVSAEALTRLSPLLRDYKAATFKSSSAALASFLDEGVASGEAKACDTLSVAETIVRVAFSMKGAAFQDGGGKVDLDALIEDILRAVDLILDGVETPGPRAKGKKRQGG